MHGIWSANERMYTMCDCFLFQLQPTRSAVRRPLQRCEATGANFGSDVATFSFGQKAFGCGVVTVPSDACDKVKFEPLQNLTSCTNFFAIVPRGKCNFSEKAYHAQRASPIPFTAIILYNIKGEPPVDMKGGKYEDKIVIPVLMVSYACMEAIIITYPASKGNIVQIKISPGYYDLFRYLIPFVVVVGFLFVVLLVSLCLKAIRLCRERRRIARKRLSKRNLKKIPTKKYRKGKFYHVTSPTRVPCVYEFVEGEKLRVLPCRHTYHCTCIDPWLTENRKVCPMCKRRVGAKRSDSESSDEERRQRQQQQPSTSTSTTTTSTSPRVDDETETSSTRHNHDVSPPSPVGTVSNVLVEVHQNHEMSGSREQLVEDEFLYDHEHDSDAEPEQEESSLSQSLQKRLKGLFNRSGTSSMNHQEFGAEISAFDHLACEEEEVILEDEPIPTTCRVVNEEDEARFRDPFESPAHEDAPNEPSSSQIPDQHMD